QPFPNFDALQPNVQFFVKHGVKGLFEQGNYSAGGNGEMGPLRAYVLAKLLWNPKTDVQKHIAEFIDAYFGRSAEAGGKMFQYVELLREQVAGRNVHAHIFDPPTAPYLTEDFLRRAEQILDEAERLADNETHRFRVQVARLPIWYVKLATDRVTGDAKAELLRRFLAIARKAGITNISEGRGLIDWAKQMGAE